MINIRNSFFILSVILTGLHCTIKKLTKVGEYIYTESKGSMSIYWDVKIDTNDSIFFETNTGRFKKSKGVLTKLKDNKYSILSYDVRDSTNIPSGVIPPRLDIKDEILIIKRNKIIFRNYVLRRKR